MDYRAKGLVLGVRYSLLIRLSDALLSVTPRFTC